MRVPRHFRDKRWQVRVGRQVQELLLAMRPTDEELTQRLGRYPRDEELAARLGVTVDDIREARQADLVFSAYSLDAPLSDQGDTGQLADVLGEDDQAVEHATNMEAATAHLDELPEREQRILALRFYGNLTQAEIGQRPVPAVRLLPVRRGRDPVTRCRQILPPCWRSPRMPTAGRSCGSSATST